MPVVVTADIVGSRRLPDRSAAQRALDETIARVDAELPVADRPVRPTVGDEQQGVFATLDDALAWLLLLQLALPDEVQCRFGVGIGAIGDIPSASGELSDGPAWWSARTAIETVHRLQNRSAPHARTWVVAASDERAEVHDRVRTANAYVLVRDQLVTTMSDRARRLTFGRCVGRTQAALADAEGITQPAVSQALAIGGSSAIVTGFRMLRPPAG